MIGHHPPHHRFHDILHAIGRRHGRRGFGRGFPGGFGQGFGGGDFPAGRKLSAEDLQLVLLALLAEQSAHGYELIRRIEERSGGFYAPSPGMVYPALTFLEEIGHAGVTQDGNRKLYSLTDAGRAHLDTHRGRAETILDALARIGGRMAEVREAFAGVDAADPQAADELHQARYALKHALIRKRDCSPAEARRIARILDRATAEILGKSD
ncbi:PadR family transcriptional regulator [Nguyenibacter vanlangensis]|uniref:PadR family transcriptional regulator n=1 Tax=Nguyenibacter vanlangensis TaxID=1216886 RepID=A0ABZ3D0Q2_9PROT